MNELTKKLAIKAGFDFDVHGSNDDNFYGWEGRWINEDITNLVNLVVDECLEICANQNNNQLTQLIKDHFAGIQPEPDRPHIGYTEREEGYYNLYAPKPGMITTQAFILCKYCNRAIHSVGGSRSDAVCFDCFNKEPELR